VTTELIDAFSRDVERAMTDAEFGAYRSFILDSAGIQMNETKRALLVSRLSKRLRQLGCESFAAYLARVKADPEERVRMFDLVTTNETQFFREPKQFEFLEQVAIPGWKAEEASGRRRRTLRVWSAACSSGEEPYSLAMLLLSHFEGWNVEILATDLSSRVLDVAKSGVWPIARTEHIPMPFLRRYMLRGTGNLSGKVVAHPLLRQSIHFRRLNLNGEIGSVKGPFDLLLCRNVMMYFERETRRRVVDELVARTAVGGYLFVGHAETLHGVSERVAPVRPTMWMRRS
jgi:chemotaxis protein methyltransferase CheR